MKNKQKSDKLVEEAASQWFQIVLMHVKHNKLHKKIQDKKDTLIKSRL